MSSAWIRARRATFALALLAAAPAQAATLLQAVQQRNVAAVRTLLAEDADANEQDVDGATPLLYAAHLGEVERATGTVAI